MKKSLLLLITLAGMPSYSFAVGIGAEGTAFAQIPVNLDVPPPSMAIEVLKNLNFRDDPTRGPLAVLKIGRIDAGKEICFDGGENPDITVVKSDNGAGDTLGKLWLMNTTGQRVVTEPGYHPDNCRDFGEFIIQKMDTYLGPPGIYTITVRARIFN